MEIATHGGARPGAGRKPKPIKHETAINRAEKQIKDRLPDIVDAQLKLALGVKVLRYNETSGDEEEIYTTLPDRQAGQYLINRIMGAPVQKQELTGENGNDLIIQVVYGDGTTQPTEQPKQDS